MLAFTEVNVPRDVFNLVCLLILLIEAFLVVQEQDQLVCCSLAAYQRHFLQDLVEVLEEDLSEVHGDFAAVAMAPTKDLDHSFSNLLDDVSLSHRCGSKPLAIVGRHVP